MKIINKTAVSTTAILGIITLIIAAPHILDKFNDTEPMRVPGFVNRIIDGDTFELSDGEKVRLICVNTPERDEEGYQEAKDFLSTLVANKTVLLERDVSDRDKFGRLLRYVYANESRNDDTAIVFVNRELVHQGFAAVKRYEPDTRRCDEIAASS